MAYEEYKEQMKDAGVPKNFTNFAKSHLEKAGQSYDVADVEAYYDPTLSYHENKELFKKAFPISSEQEMGGTRAERSHYDEEGYKRRGEEQKEFNEEREKKRFERDAKKERFIQKAREGTQPNIFEKAKQKYEEFQKGRKEAYQADVEKRMATATARSREIGQEKQLAAMEASIKQHEREQNPLNRFLKGMKGLGGSEDSMMKRALLGSPGASNQFQKALLGVKDQPKRGRYITIIEKGIARRVRVPDEIAQESPNLLSMATQKPREQPSMLAQMLMGNPRKGSAERQSVAAQALFGSTGRKERPGALAQAVLGGEKGRSGALAQAFSSGSRKSLLSGKRKGMF